MDNGEATDDGLQDTYDKALFQLVMTGFEPGDVPLMVQRAYLGDEVLPDWEADFATTDVTGLPARLCPVHLIATRHEDGTCYRCPQQPDSRTAGPATEPQPAPVPEQDLAVLIPVRHRAVPAWRMALIEALAAVITRLS